MKKKIAIFDLDGTLCELRGGIRTEDKKLLQELGKKGMKLAICSGKPVSYLSGLTRQLEINDMILMGENGSVIQFGGIYPPDMVCTLPYSRKVKKALRQIQEDLEELLPDVWFQPNNVVVTPFPRKEEDFEVIRNYLDQHEDLLEGVEIFRHVDCFDLVPTGMTKYDGLSKLTELTGIAPEEMVAIGNGVNDIPMFNYAGLALGIGLYGQPEVDKNFDSITEVLQYLIDDVCCCY